MAMSVVRTFPMVPVRMRPVMMSVDWSRRDDCSRGHHVMFVLNILDIPRVPDSWQCNHRPKTQIKKDMLHGSS